MPNRSHEMSLRRLFAHVRRAFLPLGGVALALASATHPCAGQPRMPPTTGESVPVRSIAAALHGVRVGDSVTVAGRATVSSGVLQRRGTYVALQDDSAGIWVYRRAPVADVREGDSVLVRGAVHVYRGSAELIASHIVVVPRHGESVLVPDTGWRAGGPREGRLLRLRAVAGERGVSEGGSWLRLHRQPGAGARDSITLWVPSTHAAAPDVSDVQPGDLLDVTGIAALYRDNPGDPPVWQIVARRAGDVETVGISRRVYRLAVAALVALGVLGVAVVVVARTLTRRQARALRETEARYRQLLALSPDAVLVHDAEHVLFANAAAARLLGATDEHALAGRPVASFLEPDEREALAAASRHAATRHALSGQPGSSLGHRVRTAFRASDGTSVDVEVATSPCRYLDREAAVVVARDIGPQLRYERELRELAMLDELTGLHNRRGFFMFAEAELRRLRERGSHAVLVFADLDGLKAVNDAHGHAAGDQALRDVARALREVVGEQGLAARWSGDEFVALVPDATPAAAPISLAMPIVTGENLATGSGDALAAEAFEQRLAAVLARLTDQSRGYRVSASVGARRLGPDAGETLAAALAAADAGLYRRRGRTRAPTRG